MRSFWVYVLSLLVIRESPVNAGFSINNIVNFTSTNDLILSVNGVWFAGKNFNISLHFRAPAKRIFVSNGKVCFCD
jgi:hypothetical protein